MALVNPPPNIKIPKKFLEDPEVRDYFQKKDFMIYQLWLRSGGGDDFIETEIINNITNTTSNSTFRAKLFRIEQRLDCLEANDKSSEFSSKIAQLNRRVNELIDELLAELKLQRPNEEREETAISLQRRQIKQIELLNERIEEAFNTGIELEDLE